MIAFKLHKCDHPDTDKLFKITGSKSESNRWLILQSLFSDLVLNNLSNSDDTRYLKKALDSTDHILDIGHAGTAMRFGTALFASQAGKSVVITGSDRMKERPIGILVNALQSIGAQITYLNKEGYPPLEITGKKLKGGIVTLQANVSSQYITALCLIAPVLEKGLEIELIGEVTSRPYIEMTLSILKKIGCDIQWDENFDDNVEKISIQPIKNISKLSQTVESDWSSTGYWYTWVAFQNIGYKISLESFYSDSMQGDSKLQDIYKKFGVETSFEGNNLVLTKTSDTIDQQLHFDLTEQPDQAQTIFVTCLGLGINVELTGLHTLKIKETDRIEAMKEVGSRFRESVITTTSDSIKLILPHNSKLLHEFVVDTYHDHRMALSFAPLCKFTDVQINDPMVVTKSYPDYYEHLKSINVSITEI